MSPREVCPVTGKSTVRESTAPAEQAIRAGNYSPGALRAPGMWNLDFNLAKNFSLGEKVKLQIRTDMFNALNHTNLSGLRTSINDVFFGQLLSTQGARVMQWNARIAF